MAIIQPLGIKKLVSPLSSVVKGNVDDTLGRVLSRVRSSHDAVFIYNDNDEFLGLISPYQTLYSSNFPYTTKVSSILFTPPAITDATPLYQVAKHMVATKMYVLPVVNKSGDVQSVINAKNVLQEITRDSSLLAFVAGSVKRHTPITAPTTASVKDVFYDLKEKGVSRMVIVDPQGSLEGIVTRSDLMQSLIKPTAKMRFPKEGTHAGFYSLAGEKKFRKSEPVGTYSTGFVDSLPDNTPKAQIVLHLINSSHDSIVLVDSDNKPTGFLSTRDLLQALTLLRPEVYVPLNIKRPSKAVSETELHRAMEHLEQFGKKLNKRMHVANIEVTTKEAKSPKGLTMIFNTTVMVIPVAGKALVAETKDRSYLDGIQSATKIIEKQRRRSEPSNRRTKR